MPFCTSADTRTPRSPVLRPVRRAAGRASPPRRVHLDAQLRRVRPRVPRRAGRQPRPTQAAVDALPAGHALLVVQRGPNAGSRFLLDTDVIDRRPPPRQRHLPRRHHRLPPPRRVPPRRRTAFTVARRRLPQRHLRQPRADRRGPAARRRRGPDRQVPAGVLRQRGRRREPAADATSAARPRRSLLSIGEVLAPAARRVPRLTISKIRFLEARACRPRAHAVGLPQVLRRRHRAAALHPARSASTSCR